MESCAATGRPSPGEFHGTLGEVHEEPTFAAALAFGTADLLLRRSIGPSHGALSFTDSNSLLSQPAARLLQTYPPKGTFLPAILLGFRLARCDGPKRCIPASAQSSLLVVEPRTAPLNLIAPVTLLLRVANPCAYRGRCSAEFAFRNPENVARPVGASPLRRMNRATRRP